VDIESGLREAASESGPAAPPEELRPAGMLPLYRSPRANNPSGGYALSFPALPTADAGGPDIMASLFLSLILLVLAFFIVMVSISRVDAGRSTGVIESVAGAFAQEGPGSVPQGAQRGNVVDGEDLEQSLKRLFATELAVAEFRSVVPGRTLEIEMASEVLFHREKARIRPARFRLLDRLVATVTMRPLGQRVDVQGWVSTGTPKGSALPTSPSALSIRRAGAMGEALVRRGLPRSHLAVGFSAGQNDRIVLVFSIAPTEGETAPYPPIASAKQNS
jgi:outer membrane protein OmpA-like peptidoglycan-associated protein